MASNHHYIYLGRDRGTRVVHKVGQTKQTCWARCAHADYLIGVGIEIFCPGDTSNTRSKQLNEAERSIINYFAERFPVEHGNEYFRIKKHNWEMIKQMFIAEMVRFLDEKGWRYEIHEGWVAPNTY